MHTRGWTWDRWGLIWGAVLGLGACAGSATPSAPQQVSGVEASSGGSEDAQGAAGAPDGVPEDLDSEPVADAAPPAPWQAEPLRGERVPGTWLSAWREAENAEACLPLALEGGVPEGARVRRGAVDGGWAVEFDVPGAPGVRRNGRTCRRCGRAAVGVAGTVMPPEALEEMGDVERLADGSRLHLEVEGGVASASLVVPGQDCVYQLWSFLGEAHLRALLGRLRFVAVADGGTEAFAGVGY